MSKVKMHDYPEVEEKPCPHLCAGGDEFVLLGEDRIQELPGQFAVLKCRSCGLMRTNPRPTSRSIGAYYPEGYGPYQKTRDTLDPPHASWFSRLKGIAKRVVENNTQRLPRVPTGRLLEIGCASGSFLHTMALRGWKVEGIEFSDTAAQAARERGYRVHTGALETAPDPEEPFDLIVGWMVLEHLHNPLEGLRKLRKWANPNSWLVVSVPNVDSLSFRLFRSRWYDLHLPNHLYHFSPATAEAMLKAAGWDLQRVHHQRVLNNYVVSMGYLLRDHGFVRAGGYLINFPAIPGRYLHATFPLAWLLAKVGQSGRMTLWARPKT